jgi:YVTN family beta-propeller protein
MRSIAVQPSIRRFVSVCHLACVAAGMAIAQAPAPQPGLINRDATVYAASTGKLYIVDTAHDAVIAVARNGEATNIKVGVRPDAIQINNRTSMVYVVNPGSRNVSVIDTAKDEVVATVPTAARPYAIAVDGVSNKVYVSNTFSNMLTVIDGSSNTASNLKVGSADVIMVDNDRRRVYLLGYESDTLTELNPEDGTTSKIPAGAMHLWGLARKGKILYVTHVQDANIAAIDLETHAIREIAVGAMPCAIAVNPLRDEFYVANYADGTVTVVKDNAPVATIKVSARPQGLAVDEQAQLLYVASPQQNSIALIDLRSRRVIRTIRVDDHPYTVALQPQSHAAYSVNISSNSYTPLKSR